MRSVALFCLAATLLLVLVGCSSGSPTATPPASSSGPAVGATASEPAPSASTPAGTATESPQVASGQQLYAQHCAVCHGTDLQGVSGPPLTRPTVVSLGEAVQFFDYTARQMPLSAPGSLSQQNYYDIVAYIFFQDGLLPHGTTLNSQTIGTINLSVPETATPSAEVPSPTPQAAVAVAQIPSVGGVLVDSQGYTLYYNGQDGPDSSTCTDACADAWPPLTVLAGTQPRAATNISGTLGVFQRSDGSYQVTYSRAPAFDRQPLYTYFADIEPGDRNGQFLLGRWSSIVLQEGMGQGAGPGGPIQPGQGVAAMGAADYLLNCSTCHGNQGEGVDAPPLRNSQFVQTAGDQALFQLIVNGVSGSEMPAWLQANGGPLNGGQISNVVAYLHTLQNVKAVAPISPPPPQPTPTPLPPGAPTPEPARPSEPGGPGPAASAVGSVASGRPMFGLYCALCHGAEGVQGVANLDSDDTTVPPLNPIDPTIANPNPQVFATNVDLFVEHGSVPEGEGPLLVMPPFGDANMLTSQEIADLIAYVMSLNGVTFGGTPAPSATVAAAVTPTAAPATTSTPTTQATAGGSQQVATGQQLYSQHCAMCHGANLQGVSAPALITSSLSRFSDAGALLDYVSRRMPPGSGGSLSQGEYADVTAYLLEHNGLLPSGTTLDAQNASGISINP